MSASPDPKRAAVLNAIWDTVVANRDRLNGCAGHFFSVDLDPEKPLGKHWQCLVCGGEVDSIAKSWYEDGRRDGVAAAKAGRD